MHRRSREREACGTVRANSRWEGHETPMQRREFLTLLGCAAASASALVTSAAHAQQPAKPWRVGIILAGIRTPAIEGFVQGMRELGYQAGRDYLAEWRFADGRYARFPIFAQDFVRLQVDVIVVETSAPVDLVRQVTRTIPIVMGYSVDPVGSGLITSLTRPGTNVTGMASSMEPTLPKQLELLQAAVPNLSRVALLLNPEISDYTGVLATADSSAQKAGMTVISADARTPDGVADAFAQFTSGGAQALVVIDDVYFLSRREELAGLALKHRLPSIFARRDFVQAGGLLGYGENLTEFYRRAASFVDRIFKGARAAELPIEQAPPQLTINRKTALALGVTIPPKVYALANEVIE
jgi:putative tryptophan/tyrosine transport system substrate-binding protein